MHTVNTRVTLRRLTPYEPRGSRPGRPPAVFGPGPAADGQLALALAPARPPAHPGETGPDPRRLRGVLTAILEVCGGHRQPAQLRPYLDSEVYHRLVTWPIGGGRRLLRTVHADAPADGVIEACGTVTDGGDRILAFAACFRRYPDGTRCTAFELVGRARPTHGAHLRRRPGPETSHRSVRRSWPRPVPEINLPRQRGS